MEENTGVESQQEPTDSRPPEQVGPSGPSRDSLKPILEALLFAVEEPISAARLAEAIEGAAAADIRAVLQELQRQYDEEGRGFALEEIAGGFQLLSRSDYAPYLEKLQKKQSRVKLSSAALETLAIVAYRQPITRAAIEVIRGVEAGAMLRMLVEKGMVKIVGREEVIGRPFLYGTTRRFLERFGLKSLKDLPQAGQLQMP